MTSKTRFWTAALVVLSAVNLVSVWFAARPGEPWHATLHAALALGLGLWAQERMQNERRPGPAVASLPDERLERIERAVEAVAIEVERIGEMERFASKILAARAAELEPRVAAPQPVPVRLKSDDP
jgi:hypothetical protein